MAESIISQPSSRFSTIAKSMVGSVFEWYQFSIYGYFAPIIGKVFFPNHLTDQHLLLVYSVFFAGYLARPLGGVLFGLIGDRYGRKHVLVWTLVLMSVPTFCIGLLPGYADIGILSPVCLIMCRIIQGLSMGGNYGGSLTYIFEQSHLNRRGFISSFSTISILMGLLCASLTLITFDLIFTPDQLERFGFRIPFVLGFFVSIWAYVLYKTLPESPVFEAHKKKGVIEQHPIRHLFQKNSSHLIKLVGVVVLHDLSFYILFVYMMTFFTEHLLLSKQLVFTVNTISLIIVGIAALFSAWHSDQYGRKPIMKKAALFFSVMTIPLLALLITYPNTWVILLCHSLLAVAVGIFLGPLPALMVETFDSSVRNTGITLTGNISGPLFGGSAPLIMTYLTQKTGIELIPAFYLTLSAIVAFWALQKLPINRVDDE